MEFFQMILAQFYIFIDIMLHLDQYLAQWTLQYGAWIYLIVFVVVFCETGLIVTPFLPGDSLLFALGALTAITDGGLNMGYLSGLLFVAAFVGDSVNYSVGRYAGQKWLPLLTPRWVKPAYIIETENFFVKYGAPAIVLARFAPILRTYVPFVAGITHMNQKVFFMYNVIGAVVWTQSFLWAGRFFGQIPAVQKNFSLITLGIILVSLAPVLIAYLKTRTGKKSLA
jgi:membrane-associated protein